MCEVEQKIAGSIVMKIECPAGSTKHSFSLLPRETSAAPWRVKEHGGGSDGGARAKEESALHIRPMWGSTGSEVLRMSLNSLPF
jgi:hypothetical protein